MTNPQNLSEALLPCPLCGGTAQAFCGAFDMKSAKIECQKCHLSQFSCPSAEVAVSRWNTRAAQTEASHLRFQLADMTNECAVTSAKSEELAALLWEARSYVTLQGHEGPSTGYLRDAYPEAAAVVDKLQDRISAALSGKVAG